MNAVNYLVDDNGLMELRGREFKLRLLDREKIASHRLYWQLFNTLTPVLLILLAGVIMNVFRRRRYGMPVEKRNEP